MPIYEYECNICKCRFDKRQQFSDEPLANCPECNGESKRVLVPAPVIFKGSGFYVTDYPNDKSRGSVSASTDKSSGSISGPESKSASSSVSSSN